MGTAIKHPVPDRVKPSFLIFDIRALWRSGHQRVNLLAMQCLYLGWMIWVIWQKARISYQPATSFSIYCIARSLVRFLHSCLLWRCCSVLLVHSRLKAMWRYIAYSDEQTEENEVYFANSTHITDKKISHDTLRLKGINSTTVIYYRENRTTCKTSWMFVKKLSQSNTKRR